VTQQLRVLVIVPTYNERSNIRVLLPQLFDSIAHDCHVLVVDDASPDGTGTEVRALAGRRDRLHVIERPRKLGLGTAYITAFQWGISAGCSAIVQMDADLSHDPQLVPQLLGALGHADLVIGSRYVTGGTIENWSRVNGFLSAARKRNSPVVIG
jgi:dolichol-phosphate mannosyltransferase